MRVRALARHAVLPFPRREPTAYRAGAWRRRNPGRMRGAGQGGGCRQVDDGREVRPWHAAPGIPARSPGLRGQHGAGTPAEAGRACRGSSPRGVRGNRFPRLGLPVLAVEEEGRGQPFRGQGRRGRVAGGNAALHRALHGELPARQHPWSVVGGSPPERSRSSRS